MNEPLMNIASVERETGLSKDTLRVWERRYGFPSPIRDANAERLYDIAQVRKLVLLKRLIDCGHRPGRLMRMSDDQLRELDAPRTHAINTVAPQTLDAWMGWIVEHDMAQLRRIFRIELLRRGMRAMVEEVVAPLLKRVGDGWARGEISVFEEHLFSQQLENSFRNALSGIEGGGPPRVLLTTLPGEEHTLGLLMVEGLLVAEGAYPILLGAQAPVVEIVRAVEAKRADVVCLSFSSVYSVNALSRGLGDLRAQLPEDVAVWAGGAGVLPLRHAPDGVRLLPQIGDVVSNLREWREANPAD